MKLKLVDHISKTYTTTFGTCELCMYTGETTDTTLVFRWEDGTELRADTFFWSWGDKFVVYIDNLAEFALWIGKRDFDKDEVMGEVKSFHDGGYGWLNELALEYRAEKEGWDDDDDDEEFD